MQNVSTLNNDPVMPKLVSYEIKKVGLFWRISLRGVLLKRKFLTFTEAENYVPEIHSYFGSDCVFLAKEAA